MTKTLKTKAMIAFMAICLAATGMVSCNGAATAQQAGEAHGWRGPNRDGMYKETGLLREWPVGGPEMVLKIEGIGQGNAWSSPVIVGNRIFITGTSEGSEREIFHAFTLTGEYVFSTDIGAGYTRSWEGARSTPTIVGNRAFVITGEGVVVALDTRNGEILWTVDGSNYGMRVTTWGHAESPLVFDNKVIFTVGGDQAAMMAINATNGEIIWKTRPLVDEFSNFDFEASNYSSPILIEHNGIRQIVALAQWSLFGVNPATGEIMWSENQWGHTNRRIAPNSPIFHNGRIFISNGYDLGAYQWQLNENATGVTLLWHNVYFDTHHGGQVLMNGALHGSNWFNNNAGAWMAIDWYTGETIWEEEWEGGKSKGQIIGADGMLIIYDDRLGYVGLVRPAPNGLHVVSEFRITYGEGQHWAHPVIHNGILYVRRGTVLMGFNIAR